MEKLWKFQNENSNINRLYFTSYFSVNLGLSFFKKIKIEAFSKDWPWFASIGFINLVVPFFLIAYGVKSVQSNLAAILMSTTPLSSTILGHFYTKNEKFNLI